METEVKQQTLCTYNVTLRRVYEMIVAVESNKYYIFLCVCVCIPRALQCVRAGVCVRASMCVCVWTVGGCGWKSAVVCLRPCTFFYPVCHVEASHFLRPLWLEEIYRRYLINGTIFAKQSLNVNCVFWFFQQHLFQTFLILNINQRGVVINVKASSCKVPVVFVGF
jgi:hypothetical protein